MNPYDLADEIEEFLGDWPTTGNWPSARQYELITDGPELLYQAVAILRTAGFTTVTEEGL